MKCLLILFLSLSLCQAVKVGLHEANPVAIIDDDQCEECKEAIPVLAVVLRNPEKLAYLKKIYKEFCMKTDGPHTCDESIALMNYYLKKYDYLLDDPDTLCKLLGSCTSLRAEFFERAGLIRSRARSAGRHGKAPLLNGKRKQELVCSACEQALGNLQDEVGWKQQPMKACKTLGLCPAKDCDKQLKTKKVEERPSSYEKYVISQ